MIPAALTIGAAGATVTVSVLVATSIAQRLALRRPIEGFEELPSPPRPLDYQLLARLQVLLLVAFSPFPVAFLLAALGEDAGYGEALATWAKALGPLGLVFVLDWAWEAHRFDRGRLAALFRGEHYDEPTPRSSAVRMRGVVYLTALFAGFWWVQGLPNAERPPQIILPVETGGRGPPTDPAA